MTTRSDEDAITRGSDGLAAYNLAKSSASEVIFPNADRWISFPYEVATVATPLDIAPYRENEPYTAPEAPAGKVFAGWYWDEDMTLPVGPEETTGMAFAKFVDAAVLQVKYQNDLSTYEDGRQKLRLVTTVDTLNYQIVGFRLTYWTTQNILSTIDIETTTVYEKLNSDGRFIVSIIINNTPDNQKLL